MEEKNIEMSRKSLLKLFVGFAMFLAIIFSMFFVACGAKSITVFYTDALGMEQQIITKKGTPISSLGDAKTIVGYTFDGWYKDLNLSVPYSSNEKLENNIRIYAKYTANKYRVVFYSNDGGNKSTNLMVEFNESFNLITKPGDFVKANYHFIGWSKNANDKPGSQTIYSEGAKFTLRDEGVEFFAIWEGDSQQITYNFDSMLVDGRPFDTSTLPSTINFRDKLVLPNIDITKITHVTDERVKFGGFRIGNDVYPMGAEVVITSPTTVSVEWIDRDVVQTLSFAYNKPELSTDEAQDLSSLTMHKYIPADSYTYTLPAALSEQTAFVFKEWNTKADGTGESYAPGVDITVSAGQEVVKLYAIWEAKQYTITYVHYDGTQTTENYTIEKDDIVIITSIREGYTNTNWTVSGEGSWAGITSLNPGRSASHMFGNVTLTANYEIINYTINYNLNGGTNAGTNPASYNIESETITFDDPTRTGYTFAGWFTTSTFDVGSEITEIPASSTGNVTVYAKWEVVDYSITYNLNGGTNAGTNPAIYTIEDSVTFADPTRTGYTFAGWFTTSTFDVGSEITGIELGSTGNVTVYAKWTVVSYSISYTLNGGTNAGTNPASYNIESATITFADPTRNGYTFAGWFTTSTFDVGSEITEIAQFSTGNVTVYAKWTVVNYSISYTLNGGTNAGTNPASYNIESATITFADPTRNGYTFAGWFTTSTFDVGSEITEIAQFSTGNVMVYAKWTVVNYSISYTLNGGTNAGTNPASYNIESATIVLINPTKDGYTFKGWFTEPTFETEITEIAQGSTGDVTLFAKWVLQSDYEIRYNLNGGTNAISNPASYNIESATITFADPTRNGYIFAGWFKEATFETQITQILHGSTGDITLFARWILENDYLISYALNGGTNSISNPASYNIESETITLADATKTGYTFAGWFTTSTFDVGSEITEIPAGSTGNVTVYAKWTVIEYTITLVDYNGTQVQDTYTIEDELVSPTYTREGYTNDYWTVSGEGSWTNIPAVTPGEVARGMFGNVTLTAHYSAVEYVITYYTEGGTHSNPTSYTIESETIVLSDATREGYTFLGWFEEGTFETEITEISAGSIGERSIYAKWQSNSEEYGITYILNGGVNSPLNPSAYNYVTTVTFADATKTGYAFAGWFEEGTFETEITEIPAGSTGAVTIYAKWEVVDYSITYNLNGGTNAGTNPVNYNIESETITLADPTREHYTFAGWFTTSTFDIGSEITGIEQGSTGNVIVYAKWTPVSYAINYNLNGGTNAGTNPASYTIEDSVTFADPTKEHYAFAGWFKEATFETQTTGIELGTTGVVNVYAKWEAVSYAINYNLNGGTNAGTNPASYTIEDSVTFADPTRTGYTFAGWFKEATFETQTTGIELGSTGVVNVYAKWEAVSYAINYNLNGGTNAGTNPANYTIEDSVIFADPTRTGYAFAGWFKEATFETQTTGIELGSTGVVNVYAKWEAVSYAINYNLNSGTNAGTNPASYNIESETITFANATRTGYTFAGWFTTSTFDIGSEITGIEQGSTGNVTVYAKWTPVSYAINYNLNGGTNAGTNPANYTIEQYVEFADPTRTGYTFAGWFKESTFETQTTGITVGTTGVVNLYAKWEAISYTITYNNLNGGTHSNPTSYTIEDSVTFADATRTGYTFAGWFTTSTFDVGSEITEIAQGSTGAVTIYAKWTPVSYAINYNLNGGTNAGTNPASYTIEDSVTFADATRTGYTFAGWFKESTFETQTTGIELGTTGVVNVYAKWTPIEYNVKFNSNGGNGSMENQTFTYDEAQNLTASTFTKTGYTFIGWATSASGSKVYDDEESVINLANTQGAIFEIFAVWEVETYDVTYQGFDKLLVDGEPVDTSEYQQTATYGGSLTLPNIDITKITHASDESLRFGGFIVAGETYAPGTVVSVHNLSFATVSISWVARREITISLTGGQPVADQAPQTQRITVYQGNDGTFTFTLPVISNLTGNNFAGWSLNGTTIPLAELPKQITLDSTGASTTYEAVWQAQERIIVLRDSSAIAGEELVATITTTYGANATLASAGHPSGDFADAELYTFTGWKANGSDTVYTGNLTVLFANESITLYAQYTRNTVQVSFSANGGVGSVEDKTIPTKTSYTFTAEEISAMRSSLTKQYYTLIGFNEDQNSTTGSFTISVGTSAKTYYAIWERNKITVTYDDNTGATVPSSFQIDQGSNLTLTSTGFSRTGFELVGFTYNENDYSLGESLFLTEDATLTPIWAELDAVNFRGAGAISQVYKTDNSKVDISTLQVGSTIVLPRYENASYSYIGEGNARKYFAGWSTDPNASVPSVYAGATYTITNENNNAIFYPVYMEASLCLNYTLNAENNTASVAYSGGEIENNILIYPNVYVTDSVTYSVTSMVNLTDSTGSKPNEVANIVIAEGITNVAAYMCYGMDRISNVLIPNSATIIGERAFYSYQSELNSIYIPENVTTIGSNAFGCEDFGSYGLRHAIFENANYWKGGNYYILPDALFDGSALRNVDTGLSSSVFTRVDTYYLTYTYHDDDPQNPYYSVKSANGALLYGSLSIPEQFNDGINGTAPVKEIEANAFTGLQGIKSVSLPNSLTTIGENAFAWEWNSLDELSSFTIPENVTSIGSNAIGGHGNLYYIYFNTTNASYFGTTTIADSDGIHLIVGSNVTKIPDYMFKGSHIINVSFAEVAHLQTIGAHAFEGCSSLTSITIPESVTYIGEDAFYNSGVTDVTFEDANGWEAFDCLIMAEVLEKDVADLLRSDAIGKSSFIKGNKQPLTFTYHGDDPLNPYYSVKSGFSILGHVSIPESFNDGTNGTAPVKEIEANAFTGSQKITEVTIPNSIITIGSNAFSFSVSGTMYSLNSLVIPESVTTIGENAFNLSGVSSYFYLRYEATNATYLGTSGVISFVDGILTIGENVTNIPAYLFKNSGYIDLRIENSATSLTIGQEAFAGSTISGVNIPSRVNRIEANAFYGVTTYSNYVEFENTNGWSAGATIISAEDLVDLETAADYLISTYSAEVWIHDYSRYLTFTFDQNDSSYSVKAKNGVTIYGSVLIPSTFDDGTNGEHPVTKIESNAFSGQTGLTSVTIKNEITTIGSGAFSACTSLTSVTFERLSGWAAGTTIINGADLQTKSTAANYLKDTYANEAWVWSPENYLTFSYNSTNDYYSVKANADVAIIGEVIIPATYNDGTNGEKAVRTILGSAFKDKTLMTSIILPASITTITGQAFRGCTGLTEIVIPDGVTSIAVNTFNGCTNLVSVSIPSSITNIATTAFTGCTSLTYNTFDNAKYLGNSTNPFHILMAPISTSITSCEINAQTKVINGSAFNGCTSLTTITIPSSVTTIGSSAFNGCTSLASVTIENDTVANGLTGSGSFGYLIRYATLVYIKTGLSVTGSTYLASNYTQQTSDRSGYDKYVKNS